MATAREVRTQRAQVARRFELESGRLALAVQGVSSNFRYVVRDLESGRQYNAVVLPTTFDFYEFRLHIGERNIDMLIVERHNAVVPVHVASLSQITVYEPLAVPVLQRDNAQRRNSEESNLLLSKLLLNFESAHAELQELTTRTRQRYQRKVEAYLLNKVGRPWAS
jgi:hypothetical protein